ncbi:hypothetical protein EDF56_106371 [Novosphingobium sp. PhB165]|uniref:hypothetical protein n=1 Tax=Novosphingobium sp. PhB165 TaxID=2485105 RepID=UPI0010EC62A2|nr:hypothetical protein [Novosphingobium sp. PhB165]TCM17254.1 hypothetical protein EDF56_106371 [Novosphingobium sp. PhB165]
MDPLNKGGASCAEDSRQKGDRDLFVLIGGSAFLWAIVIAAVLACCDVSSWLY